MDQLGVARMLRDRGELPSIAPAEKNPVAVVTGLESSETVEVLSGFYMVLYGFYMVYIYRGFHKWEYP